MTGTHSLNEKSNVEAELAPDESVTIPEGTASDSHDDQIIFNYLSGARLYVVISALCLCLFLTTLEIPIVSTSIVGITNHLHGFDESSWIVTAYLVTYIGFLIIFSKMGEIFGRKLLLCSSVLVFVIFSAACGAAQTITQLVVFRAFQGIGGSGIYALSMMMFFEVVPPERFHKLMSGVSIMFSLSLLVGPIFGGAINDSNSSWLWRWVFLLNVPGGAIAILLLLIYLPNHFPHHGLASHEGRKFKDTFSRASLNKVDIIGAGLLLTASVFLVTAVEEAGVAFPWRSGLVISLLILSGLLWIFFLVWEHHVTRIENVREPVFPWRFMENRVWIGMMLNAFFLGPPFTVSIFQIAQRFQVVNSTSALSGGLRLVPFTFACPIGSMISTILAGRAKIPPFYLVLLASVLQVIGFALLSTIPSSTTISKAQYGYQVIAGFGVGISISTMLLLTPFTVGKKDQAVAIGTISQFRYMGGAVGLAIATNVLNSYIKSHLSHILSPEQVGAVLETSAAIAILPIELQNPVRMVFGAGYNLQMKVVVAFAAAQIPATLMMWQKKQIVV